MTAYEINCEANQKTPDLNARGYRQITIPSSASVMPHKWDANGEVHPRTVESPMQMNFNVN